MRAPALSKSRACRRSDANSAAGSTSSSCSASWTHPARHGRISWRAYGRSAACAPRSTHSRRRAARPRMARLQARPDFANRHGTVLGGFLAALLDSATGLALLAGLPPDLTAVTTHLDTEFVKPARAGTLLAKARVASRRDRDAVVEAEIFDADGKVVARATARLRIVGRK